MMSSRPPNRSSMICGLSCLRALNHKRSRLARWLSISVFDQTLTQNHVMQFRFESARPIMRAMSTFFMIFIQAGYSRRPEELTLMLRELLRQKTTYSADCAGITCQTDDVRFPPHLRTFAEAHCFPGSCPSSSFAFKRLQPSILARHRALQRRTFQ